MLSRSAVVRSYLALWLGLFLYAVVSACLELASTGVSAGLDRFLPLQAIAAGAAGLVVASARRLRRDSALRRLAGVPPLATYVGVLACLAMIGFATQEEADDAIEAPREASYVENDTLV